MATNRLPSWLRNRLPELSAMACIHERTYAKGLATVCKEARCPNQATCAENRTATFLILGSTCTRNCSFCAVRHGRPGELLEDEPVRVAEAVAALGLRHAVVTSVTRDDLPDGGAEIFARTIRAIRSASCGTTVEVLIPDFQGSPEALRTVMDACPEVLNHNMETVAGMYPLVRPQAKYDRSLRVLRMARELSSKTVTKSGIMVGLGETDAELGDLFDDIARVGCQVLTIGQYLRPTSGHYPVRRYVTPEEFDRLRERALASGLKQVEAGPFVRSSYRAAAVFEDLAARAQRTAMTDAAAEYGE